MRRHEVITPLARVISPEQAGKLDELIAVRYWDINKDPFDDPAHFERYIDQTSGTLTWVAAGCLGRADQGVVRDFAYGAGLANWLRAVPGLRARGRAALLDDSDAGIRRLARAGLARLARARAGRGFPGRLRRRCWWGGRRKRCCNRRCAIPAGWRPTPWGRESWAGVCH